MSVNEEIIYKTNCEISAKNLAEIFRSSGIKRPVNDLSRLKQMLEHANVLITAWDGNKMIGVARGLTDFSYCCYLSDLAVNKEYQHRGVGQKLMLLVQNYIGEEAALILLSSPTAMEYYPKIGFEKIENGFKIPRRK